MAQLVHHLPEDTVVAFLHVRHILGRLRRRGHEHWDQALEVAQAQFSALHRVLVTHGLGVRRERDRAEVVGDAIAVPGRRILLAGDRVERGALVVTRAGTRDRSIAPPDRVLVVHTDRWDQILERDVVLGLRDVVEARVVHDRRRVAHARHPGARAHRVGRVGARRELVVRQAERVPDFVRDHELHEPTLQRVGERQLGRARIERTDLRPVPPRLQGHDVVVHVHVGVEDLAGARVRVVRTVRVLDRRRQPPDARVAGIFHRPIGIFLLAGRFLGDDRVAEARGLERHLPFFDALLDPRHEPGRRRRIDVVDDRLHRLGDRRRRVLLL